MKQYILAVETGGTKIQMAIGTPSGDILYNYRVNVKREKGFQGILEVVSEALPDLLDRAGGLGGQIWRMGIGFGGPVDTKRGKSIWSAQIDGWGDFPVSRYFEERTGIPTYLFNDSNAAAWGEYCRGIGQGANVFFYTNIGSGIGGGAVIDGKLFDGQGYGAAELGQSYIWNPFDTASAWPVIQLERICSGWGIENRLRTESIPGDSLLWKLCDNNQKILDCRLWSQGIMAEDTYSIKVLDETAELFSVALSNVISFFSPEIIAVGGGVSLLGEPLIKRLNEYTAKYVYKNSLGRYKIRKSRLDEEIVLVGTLLLTGGME